MRRVYNMDQLLTALQTIIDSIKLNSFFVGELIVLLWLIQIINVSVHYKLNAFGIYPRHLSGFLGIFVSPFLHGDFSHLLLNSVPLFILANLILLQGKIAFCIISLLIIFLGGFLVWIFGKRGIHIGASGLIMGYFGYLLANAYQHFTIVSVILAILCVYYFSGLLLLLIPGKKGISWEGHIFGFLAGIAVSFIIF